MNSGLFVIILLVVIVVIVGGIVKTMKKGKTTATIPKVEGENLNEFEEILNQIKENQIKKSTEKSTKKTKHTDDDNSDNEHDDEKKKMRKIDNDEEDEIDFDIKSAIVYDSILNRKKFP